MAVPRWLLGARFTNSVLKAGNIVPKPTPNRRATIKNNMFVSSGTVFINSPQADNMKKQLHTRYSPKVMTWVIRPLSTCLPENMRDTAMPTAIKVKNNPEFKVIPISLAYMAT